MTGKSDVHFDLPILSDGVVSRVKVYDKDTNILLHNGDVKLDTDGVTDYTNPANLNPTMLIKYNDIKECKFEYKDQVFPDTTNFLDIPYSSCCFQFRMKVNGNEKQYFVCHKDP